MAKEYKEIALSKEGAEALVKAMSEANVRVINGGKKTVAKAPAKPKGKK